jgi:hypothetical protein
MKESLINPIRKSLLVIHVSLLFVAAFWGITNTAIKYLLETLEVRNEDRSSEFGCPERT